MIAGCISREPGAVRRLEAWQKAGAPAGNRDSLLRSLAARCLPEGRAAP